jgi:acyl-CoA thioester hydrolase
VSNHFTYLLRVRYAECDAQGVVFNAKYLEYIDVANTEFFRAVMGSYQQLVEQGMETQVVGVTMDWNAPARFDDVVAITLSTQRIGNTSFTLKADFNNHETGQHLLSADITYVMVGITDEGFVKIAVPDDMRLTLEQGGIDVVVNHAGV